MLNPYVAAAISFAITPIGKSECSLTYLAAAPVDFAYHKERTKNAGEEICGIAQSHGNENKFSQAFSTHFLSKGERADAGESAASFPHDRKRLLMNQIVNR